jgi:hypothetical protein
MERLQDENYMVDCWARHYSEIVKTNLCTYFEWFKFKIKNETKEFCKTLPGKLILINMQCEF